MYLKHTIKYRSSGPLFSLLSNKACILTTQSESVRWTLNFDSSYLWFVLPSFAATIYWCWYLVACFLPYNLTVLSKNQKTKITCNYFLQIDIIWRARASKYFAIAIFCVFPPFFSLFWSLDNLGYFHPRSYQVQFCQAFSR